MKWHRLFGILGLIILVILAVYPQLRLHYLRGSEWKGSFASCDLDEMAYASYLQALIDGRPRKNDPYTGRDAEAAESGRESLFSVQFAIPYLVAAPARLFGLSASQAMPIISAVSMILVALALFFLIRSITSDEKLSILGAGIVIVGSAAIVNLGAINGFFEGGIAYPFFPFMRRYIPSMALPFFLVLFLCVWKGLKADSFRSAAIFSILASVCFWILVFSYFYLWTSAGAFLFSLALLVVLFRGEDWKKDLSFLAGTGLMCLAALIPYALLLSDRNEITDKVTLLVNTRQPDLFRRSEIVAYFVIMGITFALWRAFVKPADKRPYFIAALSLSAFLVFNQQIITNRSLQPFHYEFYIINYVVMLAVVLLLGIFWERFVSKRNRLAATLFICLFSGALVWGYIEAHDTTAIWDSANIARDEAMPVNMRLRQLAKEMSGGVEEGKKKVTLNFDALQGDSQPTVAPMAVLWARHQNVFGGLGWEENEIRYFKMLYYRDMNADALREALSDCQDIEACMALFGWDRFNANLSVNARPLNKTEIDEEVSRYDEYIKNYNLSDAKEPLIIYVVKAASAPDTFNNFDRWYERDSGEQVGDYIIYRVKLKE